MRWVTGTGTRCSTATRRPWEGIRALRRRQPAAVSREPRVDGASLRILRDRAAVEAALVRRHLRLVPESLPAIRWDDVAVELLVPRWRTELRQVLLPAAADLRPQQALPTDDDGLAALGRDIYAAHGDAANRYDRISITRRLGARLLMLATVRAGWTPTKGIGETVEFRRDGTMLHVHDDWELVRSGSLDPTGWRTHLEAAGLSASVRELCDATPTDTGTDADATPIEEPAASTKLFDGFVGRHTLVIDGKTATWDERTIDADDVESVRYHAAGPTLEAHFTTPSGVLDFRFPARAAGLAGGGGVEHVGALVAPLRRAELLDSVAEDDPPRWCRRRRRDVLSCRRRRRGHGPRPVVRNPRNRVHGRRRHRVRPRQQHRWEQASGHRQHAGDEFCAHPRARTHDEVRRVNDAQPFIMWCSKSRAVAASVQRVDRRVPRTNTPHVATRNTTANTPRINQ